MSEHKASAVIPFAALLAPLLMLLCLLGMDATFHWRELRYIAANPASRWREASEMTAVMAWRLGLRDEPPSHFFSDLIEAIRDAVEE